MSKYGIPYGVGAFCAPYVLQLAGTVNNPFQIGAISAVASVALYNYLTSNPSGYATVGGGLTAVAVNAYTVNSANNFGLFVAAAGCMFASHLIAKTILHI